MMLLTYRMFHTFKVSQIRLDTDTRRTSIEPSISELEFDVLSRRVNGTKPCITLKSKHSGLRDNLLPRVVVEYEQDGDEVCAELRARFPVVFILVFIAVPLFLAFAILVPIIDQKEFENPGWFMAWGSVCAACLLIAAMFANKWQGRRIFTGYFIQQVFLRFAQRD